MLAPLSAEAGSKYWIREKPVETSMSVSLIVNSVVTMVNTEVTFWLLIVVT